MGERKQWECWLRAAINPLWMSVAYGQQTRNFFFLDKFLHMEFLAKCLQPALNVRQQASLVGLEQKRRTRKKNFSTQLFFESAVRGDRPMQDLQLQWHSTSDVKQMQCALMVCEWREPSVHIPNKATGVLKGSSLPVFCLVYMFCTCTDFEKHCFGCSAVSLMVWKFTTPATYIISSLCLHVKFKDAFVRQLLDRFKLKLLHSWDHVRF